MQHSALFLVVVLLAVSPLATTAAVFERIVGDTANSAAVFDFECFGGVYTANSTYEANLRRLAAILPAETASSQSLQAFRGVGYWPNRLRAFSRCYRHPDASSSSCAACVADAFREAERGCPYGKKVAVFARNCTLSLADFPRSLAFEKLNQDSVVQSSGITLPNMQTFSQANQTYSTTFIWIVERLCASFLA